MTPDWTNQNRANGQWMLRHLQELSCQPRQSSGGQYYAHCPFHQDEKPSFTLNAEKGAFHCFGCGLYGYIQHFAHALEAKRFAVDYPSTLSKLGQKKFTQELRRRTELLKVPVDAQAVAACHAKAIDHWHKLLLNNPTYRRLVCEPYDAVFTTHIFSKSTGTIREESHRYTSPQFTDATVERFHIGFASPSNIDLVRELRKDFSNETIIGTGLFRGHGNNGMVCVIAGRVVYPYLLAGRSVYAIGRLTEYTPCNLAHCKYFKQKSALNGQQLPLQNPPLFNPDVIDQARVVLITEGITDAIAACQAGADAISPVTTAFQRDKLDEIAERLRGKQVIICNDSEESGTGERCAERMKEELTERGVDVRCVRLPRFPDQKKVDVCSFIREEGAATFHALIERRSGISLLTPPC
ncbi:MAG: CHC2 zinc finger domain-containing protein [Candidatus Peribacteraceae bacterium]|nr:CHC2 zinc finger domain-containing protein [Candidatus Peribacteraceae bacterium]MDD5739290.1 CHC2 zinc finger domain-containing protein [Candidatus Peribacteraceae bacterium]